MSNATEILSTIVDDNAVGAKEAFGQAMLDKLRELIDTKREDVAQSLFNSIDSEGDGEAETEGEVEDEDEEYADDEEFVDDSEFEDTQDSE